MKLTLDLSEDLAARLRGHEGEIPKLLELGLRETALAEDTGFRGYAEVLETLASLPSPERVLALTPSPELESRIERLLDANRSTGLTPDEEQEWQRYAFLEHLVRIAKAEALLRMREPSAR